MGADRYHRHERTHIRHGYRYRQRHRDIHSAPLAAPRASHARPRPRPQLDAPHGARTSRGQLAGAFVAGQTYTEAAGETPLYAELVASWTASAATVPGIPDSEWQRLTSYQSFLREVESVLRDLRPHRAPDMLRR